MLIISLNDSPVFRYIQKLYVEIVEFPIRDQIDAITRIVCNLDNYTAVYHSYIYIEHLTDCDKSQCKGPTRFYDDLQCKPIYEKPGDCCAAAYDCSHLNDRSTDKCYANGHEYSIGEKMRDEDVANPCDKIGCFCHQGFKGV